MEKASFPNCQLQKGLEGLGKCWMNFQIYRKPPHCLCSFLKCFQKKITLILYRGSEKMFDTDKRHSHTPPFFFYCCKHWVMERENHLPQICARDWPVPGLWRFSLWSRVLAMRPSLSLALTRRLECACGQNLPSPGQTHGKKKKQHM